MKFDKASQSLKYLICGAGLLGLVLRILLYSVGIDGRGLLVRNHPAAIALWCLTAVVAVVLLVFCRRLSAAPTDIAATVSVPAALGSYAAMVGIAFTVGREFSEFSSRLNLIVWILGICAMLALGRIGLCQLTGKKPFCLLHAIVCIYFALRMVSQYRLWSSDPQLLDYCFYLCAYVALMLTAYQQAAFDAGMGRHRQLWFYSLASVYLCCLSLKGSHDTLLLLSSAVWALTNLTQPEFKKADAPVAEET